MRLVQLKVLCLAAIAASLSSQLAGQTATVSVDATTSVRVVDERVFGLNTPFWDSYFTNATSLDALTQMGTRIMRYGGGSDTDETDWSTNMDTRQNFSWAFNIDDFAVRAKALNAQAIITTNYGSGTPQLAAAYVAYANGTKGYGFKYWEIGNECYGTWEYDTHALQHDPYTYATLAVQYIQMMKAADPTIKVGVVAVTGEDTYAVGFTSHPATNPRTNTAHNGWTPVMLATMKAAGVLPDFLIYHRYEQNPGQESDAGLLQAALSWPQDAANLRQQLSDYLGSSGAGVELLVTENNSVNSNPGKQSVSLVNGLYLADSVANVMQTEFNSLVWWGFYNGPTSQSTMSPINLSASLYGWRTTFGDYGVQNQATGDRYPTFYISKLLSHFARNGDTVIKASSNSTLLSAYAVKRLDGSVTVLVINKSPTSSYATTFTVAGFVPQGSATVYSYGMPQDNAAQTPGGPVSPDISVGTMSGAGPSFTATFAPYSATVVSLTGPTAGPVAVGQPSSQTVATGSTAVFSFNTTGSPAPTYQWYLNGAAITNAVNATLVVNGASASSAGTLTCVATNASGSVTSSAAVLTVAPASNPGHLINLSTRAMVGTNANILIAGFVVGGAGSEPLLVRASGPALTPLGVPGVLADPQLTIISGSTDMASNSGWNGDPTIKATAASVGAFPWNTPTSHDAAVAMSLGAGAYSASVAGASNDTGVALAEVYDATPAGTFTASSPRLVNLSARVMVGTNANVLIAGFVVGGSTAKTVLIRASGPALVPFGVPGTLADPELQLLSGTTVIASNTGWGGDPTIVSTAAAVGAFPWGSAGSKDSAILITLPPGAYTAQVSGASGDTGVALVEVYDVP